MTRVNRTRQRGTLQPRFYAPDVAAAARLSRPLCFANAVDGTGVESTCWRPPARAQCTNPSADDDPHAMENIGEVYDRVPDFPLTDDEDGMTIEEVDTHTATGPILWALISLYDELARFIREDFSLSDPDVR